MPEWTSEQLSAINSFREPVIVSAAAGSGKTAVLVERTIRILSDKSLGVPADSILAVTFTNDAADQMREKLANALEEAGDKNPDSDWLQSQQALLGLASICTINSFCFDMVRNNLIGTGFRPGLRIMEKAEADMI
ncbi:MAG TPA: UvrD-helicase domain-containing protein, partial [Candidatus Faeciplasma avium]|nr:UvrD-helicase domain-containing protein [Candidatus Faeciplasma avium]